MADATEAPLTFGEYWLLETAVECRIPLCMLVHPQIEQLFNKPSHNLGREELAEVLWEMLRRGDLVASLPTGASTILTLRDLQSSLQHVPTAERRNVMGYALTSQGGAKWEAAAHPAWNRYVDAQRPTEGYDFAKRLCDLEVTAAMRQRVEKYYQFFRKWDAEHVVPGSEEWKLLCPWQATYWKELPVGHQLRFRYVEPQRVLTAPPGERDDLLRWYVEPRAFRTDRTP